MLVVVYTDIIVVDSNSYNIISRVVVPGELKVQSASTLLPLFAANRFRGMRTAVGICTTL